MKRRSFNNLGLSLVASAAATACGGGGSSSSNANTTTPAPSPAPTPTPLPSPVSQYPTGGKPISDAEYAVLAQIAPSYSPSQNTLPANFDNTLSLPPVGNQGQQGSCTLWAVAYGMATQLYCTEQKLSAKTSSNQASPADLYAKVIEKAIAKCNEGVHIKDALSVLKSSGCDSLLNVPYASTTNGAICATASQSDTFKISDYTSITNKNVTAIKTALAAGKVVPFDMKISVRFNSNEYAEEIYVVRSTDTFTRDGQELWHSMLLVGYDDNKSAWKALNSWGTVWGSSGFTWIHYDTFDTYARSAGIPIPVTYTSNQPPVLTLTRTTGTAVATALPYEIQVSTTDVDGNLSHIDVNWNDGQPVERLVITTTKGIGSHTATFHRSFATAKTIYWSCTAYDLSGRASNMLQGNFQVTTATPTNQPPSLQLQSSTGASVFVGDTFEITLLSKDADADLKNIDVNWNDESAVVSKTISGSLATTTFSKTFGSVGRKYWSSTVYDAKGLASNMLTGYLDVNEKPMIARAPTLQISGSTGSSIVSGQAYIVSLFASDADSNLSNVKLTWSDASIENFPVSGNNAYATFSKVFTATSVKNISWTAVASDSGGLSSTSVTGTFTVNAPAVQLPTISSIASVSPPFSATGVSQTLTVNGSNFSYPLQLTWTHSAGSGNATISSGSATQFTFAVTPSTSSAGNWQFKVTTSAGASTILALACQAAPISNTPQLTSFNPSSLVAQSGSQNLTLYGNYFQSGAKVYWSNQGQSNVISSANTTFISSTEMRISLITTLTGTGTWTFYVVNPDGKSSNSNSLNAANLIVPPAISSFNKASLVATNTLQTLILNGSNLSGATVYWRNGSASGSISSANTVSSSNSVQITLRTTTTGTGTWYFYVTTSSGTSNTMNIVSY